MTMTAPYTEGPLAAYPTGMGAYKRRKTGLLPPRRRAGMGQGAPATAHWYDGIVNAFENVTGGLPVNAPEAGGGWVSQPNPSDPSTNLVTGTDANGNPTTYTVPTTWTPDQITQDLAQATGAGTTPPIIPPALQIPTWVWWALGGTAFLFLLGFSGVGKLIPRANPRHYRRRHNRRRSRSRR